MRLIVGDEQSKRVRPQDSKKTRPTSDLYYLYITIRSPCSSNYPCISIYFPHSFKGDPFTHPYPFIITIVIFFFLLMIVTILALSNHGLISPNRPSTLFSSAELRPPTQFSPLFP